MTLAFSGRQTLRLAQGDQAPHAAGTPMTHEPPTRPQPADPAPLRPRSTLPCHDARALTGPTGTAEILLDGQIYCLRITRAGKLILTK